MQNYIELINKFWRNRIDKHLNSGDMPIEPIFLHHIYFNYSKYNNSSSEKSIKMLCDIISLNYKIFHPHYKKLKKLRYRNYYGIEVDLIKVNAVVKLLQQMYFKKYNYKSLRREFKSKRKHFFKNLIKKQKSCVFCGATERLSVDHIIPLVKGGRNNLSNMQILCISCNSKKGSKIL